MSQPENYTIGWICALQTEFVAAAALLDEEHPDLQVHPQNDNNTYKLGRFGQHRVVIAVLPDGQYGLSSATGVARDLLRTFTALRFGLLVGIAGGAPSLEHPIRLGDVIVSSPTGIYGGVVQYDFGKALQGQKFRQTGHLNQPPRLVRTAITKLRGNHELNGHHIQETLSIAFSHRPHLVGKYGRPQQDVLYRSSVIHPHDSNGSCSELCGSNAEDLEPRTERRLDENDPLIYYGLIASANTLMRDARQRDRLAQEVGVLCFEMEAAGLMNEFPFLVVRGVCDYSDTHKNKLWQGYAAMTAAAYTKELLSEIAPDEVQSMKSLIELVQEVRLDAHDAVTELRQQRRSSLIRWISQVQHEANFESAASKITSGTGRWLLDHPAFSNYRDNPDSSLLWLNGGMGTGKSTLFTTVLQSLRSGFRYYDDLFPLHFYCSRSSTDISRSDTTELMRCILSQLLRTCNDDGILDVLHEAKNRSQQNCSLSFEASVNLIVDILNQRDMTFLCLDALDECDKLKQSGLIKSLASLIDRCRSRVKIFTTSRDNTHLKRIFYDLGKGQSISMKDENTQDIELYVQTEVPRLLQYQESHLAVTISQETQKRVEDYLLKNAQGMFRWVELQLSYLSGLQTLESIEHRISRPSPDLMNLYQDIFKQLVESITTPEEQSALQAILQWLIVVREQLRPQEIIFLMNHRSDSVVLQAKEEVTRLAKDLVVYDDHLDTFRFAHLSVREFFESRGQILTPSITVRAAHEMAAIACLRAVTNKSGALKRELQTYAAFYWMIHAEETEASDPSSDYQTAARAFLDPDSRDFGAWAGWISHTSLSHITDGRHMSRLNHSFDYQHHQPLSIACGFNLQQSIDFILLKFTSDEIKRICPNYETVLHLTASYGHVEILGKLLEKNISIDIRPLHGWSRTPLHTAIEAGQLKSVRWLIGRGATITKKYHLDAEIDALDLSLSMGLEEVSAYLWSVMGDALYTDLDARLIYATTGGLVSFCHSLIALGANIDTIKPLRIIPSNVYRPENAGNLVSARRLNDHVTPLSVAAVFGHQSITEYLIEAGARAGSTQAAALAVENGQLTSVRSLLNEISDLDLSEPLVAACTKIQHQDASALLYREPQINLLRLILHSGVDVNRWDSRGHLALPTACGKLDFEAVYLLLEMSADPNLVQPCYKSPEGQRKVNALHATVQAWYPFHQKRPLLDILIEHGARCSELVPVFGSILNSAMQPLKEGLSLKLHQNFEHDLYDLVDYLIAHGADPDPWESDLDRPLLTASRAGHTRTVQLLLNRGARVNIQNSQIHPIEVAGKTKSLEAFNLLLKHGAVFDANEPYAIDALCEQIWHQRVHNVRRLISLGVDVDRPNQDGLSAVTAIDALNHIDPDMIELLMNFGAHIDQAFEYSETSSDFQHFHSNGCLGQCGILRSGTLFHKVSITSTGRNIQTLIRFAADVNARSTCFCGLHDGFTPFMLACMKLGKAQIHSVKMLLCHGADINMSSVSGTTALHLAARLSDDSMFPLLIESGANIDAYSILLGHVLGCATNTANKKRVKYILENGNNDIDRGGREVDPPLHIACRNGWVDFVNLFLDHGASVNGVRGKYGSALRTALRSGHKDVAILLVKRGARIDDELDEDIPDGDSIIEGEVLSIDDLGDIDDIRTTARHWSAEASLRTPAESWQYLERSSFV